MSAISFTVYAVDASSGHYLEGAAVKATHITGYIYLAVTDVGGSAIISGPDGAYTLEITRPGYEPYGASVNFGDGGGYIAGINPVGSGTSGAGLPVPALVAVAGGVLGIYLATKA